MSASRSFVDAAPGLRSAMKRSASFAAIRDQAALDLDGERLYIVRGDTLGSEEDLFVEALVRGAQQDDSTTQYRALYLELGDEERSLVDARVKAAAGGVHAATSQETDIAGGTR